MIKEHERVVLKTDLPAEKLEAGDVDDFLRPGEVAAVEVYSSSTTPAEYEGARRGSCSTVVVWTARRLDRGKKNPKP